MKNSVLLITIVVSLYSLSGCSNVDKKVTSKTDEKTSNAILANKLLTIQVAGMVCEKGCGSTIRKGLYETGGVSSCTFDYKEKRAKNTALIEFDKDKISADEIIQVIQNLNDHQFQVSESSTQTLEAKVQKRVEGEASTEEASKINMAESRIEMPNLLRLFSSLIREN
jgi:copper chaperone CopZ